MSYQRMTFAERMEIFKMYHIEHLKIPIIALRLNRNSGTIRGKPVLFGLYHSYYRDAS